MEVKGMCTHMHAHTHMCMLVHTSILNVILRKPKLRDIFKITDLYSSKESRL